ncbi:unannotated protein [freshwater metagenome]|uniref:Unannotated protein n=1 Tax=freshwater metagenome TaxID=449393 RepID=A0A6J7H5R5_9ZZZZ
MSATSTNGAGVSWATGTLDSIRTNDVTTTGIATAQLNVNNGGVTTPLTTTVTISLNGAVIGTKTIKFTGQAAKIVVSSVPSAIGVGLSANAKYTVLDSAGNQLAGWASEAGLATLDTNLSAAAGAATSSTTTATVSLTTGSDTGASETTIRVKLDDGTYVTSAPIKTISSGTFSTYSMSLDKAIYAPGEVVTVTIVGKDEDGNIVADGTSLTSSVTGVSWAGGAAVSTTDWDGLTSLKGAWVKKYYASTIVGNYGMSFKSDDTNTSTAVPVALEATYKVADSGVGLPDVLKAMVSLIASINKQIAALQKALLKKK